MVTHDQLSVRQMALSILSRRLEEMSEKGGDEKAKLGTGATSKAKNAYGVVPDEVRNKIKESFE